MNPLHVKIFDVDFYMSSPVPNFDVTFSQFRGSATHQVPVIRIFGSTDVGTKTCIHIHGVFPYFYIPYDRSEEASGLMYKIASNLDKALNISLGQTSSNSQHVYKIVLVSGIPLYGYHSKKHQFFKVYLYNPMLMKRANSLLFNESILGKIYQPHETHLNFTLQFMIDYNLHGMSNIILSQYKIRQTDDDNVFNAETLSKVSSCELECDTWGDYILNRKEIESGNLAANPGIAALWEDERQRRRNKNEDSQLPHCLSLSKTNIPPTASHIMFRNALLVKLDTHSQDDEKNDFNSSVYPAECPTDQGMHNCSQIDYNSPSSSQSNVSFESQLDETLNITIDQDVRNLLDVLTDLEKDDSKEDKEGDSILSQDFKNENEDVEDDHDMTITVESFENLLEDIRLSQDGENRQENIEAKPSDTVEICKPPTVPQLDGNYTEVEMENNPSTIMQTERKKGNIIKIKIGNLSSFSFISYGKNDIFPHSSQTVKSEEENLNNIFQFDPVENSIIDKPKIPHRYESPSKTWKCLNEHHINHIFPHVEEIYNQKLIHPKINNLQKANRQLIQYIMYKEHAYFGTSSVAERVSEKNERRRNKTLLSCLLENSCELVPVTENLDIPGIRKRDMPSLNGTSSSGSHLPLSSVVTWEPLKISLSQKIETSKENYKRSKKKKIRYSGTKMNSTKQDEKKLSIEKFRKLLIEKICQENEKCLFQLNKGVKPRFKVIPGYRPYTLNPNKTKKIVSIKKLTPSENYIETTKDVLYDQLISSEAQPVKINTASRKKLAPSKNCTDAFSNRLIYFEAGAGEIDTGSNRKDATGRINLASPKNCIEIEKNIISDQVDAVNTVETDTGYHPDQTNTPSTIKQIFLSEENVLIEEHNEQETDTLELGIIGESLENTQLPKEEVVNSSKPYLPSQQRTITNENDTNPIRKCSTTTKMMKKTCKRIKRKKTDFSMPRKRLSKTSNRRNNIKTENNNSEVTREKMKGPNEEVNNNSISHDSKHKNVLNKSIEEILKAQKLNEELFFHSLGSVMDNCTISENKLLEPFEDGIDQTRKSLLFLDGAFDDSSDEEERRRKGNSPSKKAYSKKKSKLHAPDMKGMITKVKKKINFDSCSPSPGEVQNSETHLTPDISAHTEITTTPFRNNEFIARTLLSQFESQDDRSFGDIGDILKIIDPQGNLTAAVMQDPSMLRDIIQGLSASYDNNENNYALPSVTEAPLTEGSEEQQLRYLTPSERYDLENNYYPPACSSKVVDPVYAQPASPSSNNNNANSYGSDFDEMLSTPETVDASPTPQMLEEISNSEPYEQNIGSMVRGKFKSLEEYWNPDPHEQKIENEVISQLNSMEASSSPGIYEQNEVISPLNSMEPSSSHKVYEKKVKTKAMNQLNSKEPSSSLLLKLLQSSSHIPTKYKEEIPRIESPPVVNTSNTIRHHVSRSDQKICFMPLYPAPSSQDVINSLISYDIPKVRPQEPFYSNVQDASVSMEVGCNILKVKTKTDVPDFFSEFNGLEYFRTSYFPQDLSLKAGNPKYLYCREGHCNLKPVQRPPTRSEVEEWIKRNSEPSKVAEKFKSKKSKIYVPCSQDGFSENDMSMNLTLTLSPTTSAMDKTITEPPEPSPEIDLDHLQITTTSEREGSPLNKDEEPELTSGTIQNTPIDISSTPTSSKSRDSRGSSPVLTKPIKHKKKNQSIVFRKSFLSQISEHPDVISGVTLDNTYGFQCSVQNYQNARPSIVYEYITIFAMELHVNTRDDFKPNPQYDSVEAIFYCISNDVEENTINPRKSEGVFVVESKPEKPKHPLFLDGTGIPYDVKYVPNESELFKEFSKFLIHWDPDILLGYEIQMASWGYLIERCFHLGINIIPELSRVKDKHLKFNEKDTGDLRVSGRVVLDLWRLLRHEIALQSYTIQSTVYEILQKRIPLYSFKDLTTWWIHESSRFRHRTVNYYMTCLNCQLKILEQLDFVGRTSELARLFGIQFYEVLSRGSQFRVESMMLRLAKPMNYVAVSPSVQQRAAMKAPEYIALVLEPESKFYTDPVIVLDFQSLYPSIIIAYNYCYSTCVGRVESLGKNTPFVFGASNLKISKERIRHLVKSDLLNFSPCGVAFVKKSVRDGIMPRMLREILDTRLMVKKSMKENKNDAVLQKVLHNRQLGLKLIANVTYGYTAANFSGRMPSVELGDSIVSKARETLQRTIELVDGNKDWKVKVVYGDTDSLFVLCPGKTREEAFDIGEKIVEAVGLVNPDPVKLKLEKVYQPCILQTKKRYVGYMYESPDQNEPTYDAKGIETVRRDGCPAVAKMLEKSLRILFETKDVSKVKQYCVKQFNKIVTGRISIKDLTFAKEFRGLTGYRPGACVPALELAKKWVAVDKRAEPRRGERVPYVIINGLPGSPLIRLVRSPHELLKDASLRPNALYYITRVIIPPLNRCFNLIGVDLHSWFTQMPRKHLQSLPTNKSPTKKSTISHYFTSTLCAICGVHTQNGLCDACRNKPQETVTILNERVRQWERFYQSCTLICATCSQIIEEPKCISLDCPVLYRLTQTNRDLQQSDHIRQLLSQYFDVL